MFVTKQNANQLNSIEEDENEHLRQGTPGSQNFDPVDRAEQERLQALEKAAKYREEQAHEYEQYINDSGIQLGFEIIIAEIVEKQVP